MKRLLIALLPALALVSGCAHERLQVGETAEGEVVEAVGETMNDSSDVLGTKKRALVEAQKKAVEMVVGLRVTGKTLVEKAIEIQSSILARSDGYIKKYDVEKEWVEPPLYKMKIKALVSYQQVSNDLDQMGLLKAPQVGNPRVAVLLTETASGTGDDTVPTDATNAVTQALLDKGYRVVDRADLMAAQAQKVADEVEKGETANVGSLGKKLDAEVLVFGNAKAAMLTADGLGGLISYRATLTGQAYKAQTNEIMMTVSKVASGLDATKPTAAMKALSSVGKTAGEDLAGRLADELMKRSFVSITVNGLPDLNHLSDIEKVVSGVPGVGDYYLRSFSSGQAHLDVQLQSAAARDIASAIEKANNLSAKVQNVTQDTIDVTIESPVHP